MSEVMESIGPIGTALIAAQERRVSEEGDRQIGCRISIQPITISNGRYRIRLDEAMLDWLGRQWPRSMEAVKAMFVWNEATGGMRIGLAPAEPGDGVKWHVQTNGVPMLPTTPPMRLFWKSAAAPVEWHIGGGEAFGLGVGTRVLSGLYTPAEREPLLAELWRAGAQHTELSGLSLAAKYGGGYGGPTVREEIERLRAKYGVKPAKAEATETKVTEVSFETRLQEGVKAFNEMLAQAPDEWEITGSILERSGGGHFLRLTMRRSEEVIIE